MSDLQSFVQEHKHGFICINRPTELDFVGSLTAQAGAPILFENIRDYPGFRLVDQLFVNRQAQARVLGCEPHQVVQRLAEVLHEGPKPLKEVEGGPCQERVYQGDDVDLSMLPIVRHTDLDPYPYTTSFAVHRDPETGQYNQMFPRCGVLGRNEMVSSFVTRTANMILAKHRAAGTKMPQAVVIGCHPAWELAGCYSHPHRNWWEFELFETISGEPGRVTRCLTVDLIVPADASIVIEGYVDPTRTAQDGPSPGPTMLFTPYVAQQPVFEVTAITMRRDPIYRNHLVTPFTDHQEMPRLFHEAIIYERLQALGVTVRDVHFPQGGGSLVCIIQIEPAMDGQVTDALLSVLSAPFLNMKMAIAIDPDINIYDYRDVQYALATRIDPARDVIIVKNARAFPYDPSATPVVEASPAAADLRFPSVVGKWGLDATKPVPYRAAERKNYERAWPVAWGKVRLEDYLD
ncbi:MAG: UbiD family decarboxylase [Chloroflexi bacterium]|nr:UbiD family decarboxylase [Chloroflexota bacterium]MCI0727783.1 UbiD family decarboxylase [Chloroflexota bacterium]